MDIRKRLRTAKVMQEHYAGRFELFLEDYFDWLGFDVTEVQADIGAYIADTSIPKKCVMAQRGEAKSTIAIARALHRIVEAPVSRVLIVSAAGNFANTLSYAIVKSIMSWERLSYLKPDKNAGDRTSTSEGFDVHYSLRGVDKQPSIKAVGITGQLPGNRADLLISDDVEVGTNSRTAGARDVLLEATKEYSAICTHGEILYLGTPQSRDSIYNTLPGRGFDVRIWPGRFPSVEEEERYGGALAPLIKRMMAEDPSLRTGWGLCGTKGRSTDLGRYSEQDLIDKFLDYQEHGFQLQFMLDTSLADALRQQLKLADLIVFAGGSDSAPDMMHWSGMPRHRVDLPNDFYMLPAPAMYGPADVSDTWVNFDRKLAFLDPAGGGKDESAIVVTSNVGPYIHVIGLLAYRGGQTEENVEAAVKFLVDIGCTSLEIEDNMGHGTVPALFRSELRRQEASFEIFGSYATGQKELRILDRLFSVSTRHRIVIHQSVIDEDNRLAKMHGADYGMLLQYEKITPERGSLVHDDRLEALAGSIQRHVQALSADEETETERRLEQQYKDFMADPMGTAKVITSSTARRPRGRRRRIH